jgi:hypothetical protein
MHLRLDENQIRWEPQGSLGEGRVHVTFVASEVHLQEDSVPEGQESWLLPLREVLAHSGAVVRWQRLSTLLKECEAEYAEALALMGTLEQASRKALQMGEGLGQIEKKLLATEASAGIVKGRASELQKLLAEAADELRQEAREKLDEILSGLYTKARTEKGITSQLSAMAPLLARWVRLRAVGEETARTAAALKQRLQRQESLNELVHLLVTPKPKPTG